MPVLELPPTQERHQIEIAESDIFYRTALESKLMTLEQSTLSEQTLSDQTILPQVTMQTTMPGTKAQKRRFNLQKLLANAVYPEECSQDQQQLLVNASFIQNHVTCGYSNSVSLSTSKDESDDLDETVVDEELILSLTQPHGAIPHDATCEYTVAKNYNSHFAINQLFSPCFSEGGGFGTFGRVAAVGGAE